MAGCSSLEQSSVSPPQELIAPYNLLFSRCRSRSSSRARHERKLHRGVCEHCQRHAPIRLFVDGRLRPHPRHCGKQQLRRSWRLDQRSSCWVDTASNFLALACALLEADGQSSMAGPRGGCDRSRCSSRLFGCSPSVKTVVSFHANLSNGLLTCLMQVNKAELMSCDLRVEDLPARFPFELPSADLRRRGSLWVQSGPLRSRTLKV
jgi:hypothetical protein